ncbi:hypothetical protein MOBT1_001570 [Malassezia obtusa]|uniref:RNI-like protein n=1 Tax=Malassezia obtusa TaxID=76774 RepID=A0AAF0IT40_9BASI|nr:hypothetical protein MOBT1_001570 [Malassezia obtusa]
MIGGLCKDTVTTMPQGTSLPAEIVQRLCEIVYLSCIPLCTLRTLDPEGLPSASFDGQTVSNPVDETRRDLYSLCLVNKAFLEYSQPLLFRRVQITLPYRFMLLLNEAERDMASSALSAIRLLDFATFRAVGLRRTVGESQERRFVTPERLRAMVDAASGLVAFGSSATMDSALSLDVLESLLLRGGARSLPGRMRGVSIERGHNTDTHNALQSLDLCGCVSPRFVEAMIAFVEKHLAKVDRSTRPIYDLVEEDEDEAEYNEGDEEEERGRSSVRTHDRFSSTRHAPRIPIRAHGCTFPSLQRLGMAGVTLSRDILSCFVQSFPNLTHLDLSQTKADAGLLEALADSHVRLESLSLSRCRAVTSQSIVDLLFSPATEDLIELALQGTLLFPTPLSPDDLRTILQRAPCMRSGAMRYLDLGGCPLTDEELKLFNGQPALLDLGLGSIPSITLDGVANLLKHRTPNVQVLDLSHSCGANSPSGFIHAVNLYHDLLAPCTQRPQALALAQQLRKLGLKQDDASSDEDTWQAPTNLRVVELSVGALNTVRGGLSTWKVVWGTGRRGWVVDTAAGPNPSATDIDVDLSDADRGRSPRPVQVPRMQRLASASPAPTRSLALEETRTPSVLRTEDSRGRTRPAWPTRSGSLKRSNSVARRTLETQQPSGRTLVPPNPTRSRSLSLSVPRARHDEPSLEDVQVAPQVVRDLPPEHPRRMELEHLSRLDGTVPGTIGWHSHKMEVLLGYGMLGHEIGNYAWLAYQAS